MYYTHNITSIAPLPHLTFHGTLVYHWGSCYLSCSGPPHPCGPCPGTCWFRAPREERLLAAPWWICGRRRPTRWHLPSSGSRCKAPPAGKPPHRRGGCGSGLRNSIYAVSTTRLRALIKDPKAISLCPAQDLNEQPSDHELSVLNHRATYCPHNVYINLLIA